MEMKNWNAMAEAERIAYSKGAIHQKEIDSVVMSELLQSLNTVKYFLETCIHATSTGAIRSILTDANIENLAAIEKANNYLKDNK